ncbi:MAG: hypothetical protein KDD04_05655 [Sinomicrobium sp.]|nr:hypothetical protein [Sinomicrobium sp.]
MKIFLKIALYSVAGLFLALPFIPAAEAMTVSEFETLPGTVKGEYLATLIADRVNKRVQIFPEQKSCVENEFFVVTTNTLGIPDGSLYVTQEVELSKTKNPNKVMEDVVADAVRVVSESACSAPEPSKNPPKEKRKDAPH